MRNGHQGEPIISLTFKTKNEDDLPVTLRYLVGMMRLERTPPTSRT